MHRREAVLALLTKGCVGQDLNLGTPARPDPESGAFDHAWLPTRARANRWAVEKPC